MFWKSKKDKIQEFTVSTPVEPQPTSTLISNITRLNKVDKKNDQSKMATFGQQGLTMKAQMSFQEPVELSGIIEGCVYSSSTIIVKQGTLIRAELDVENLVVYGEIDSSQINVRSLTQLKPNGSICGLLQTKSLAVEGGKLNAKCCISN